MNMKTNVIFKNGLNLVCNEVSAHSDSSFLYVDDLADSAAIEIMNECLKNKWAFAQVNSLSHPRCIRLYVNNDQIERFAWTF